MAVEINILLTFNGEKHTLTFEEAKELYNELDKIISKKEQLVLNYPPGVRGGITDAVLNKKETYIDSDSGVPITAKLNDDENNMNPTYGGIREFSSGSIKATGVEDTPKRPIAENAVDDIVLEENREVQDAMIKKLQTHEEEISTELEELQKRTREMNSLVENFNKK